MTMTSARLKDTLPRGGANINMSIDTFIILYFRKKTEMRLTVSALGEVCEKEEVCVWFLEKLSFTLSNAIKTLINKHTNKPYCFYCVF